MPVDRILVDIHHLEPPAVDPAHHPLVALQARAFEETTEGTQRGHANLPTEYLTDDLFMTDGPAMGQTLCTQDDTDDEAFDDCFRVIGSVLALLGEACIIQHAAEINPFHQLLHQAQTATR